MISTAVRLASIQDLGSKDRFLQLSAVERELRHRLWFSLGVLDLQSAFDRGSRPLLESRQFVAWPLNLDDADIPTHEMRGYVPQDRFTEMSFSLLTYRAGICQRRLTEFGIAASEGDSTFARAQQINTLAEFENYVDQLQAQLHTSSTTIAAFTVAVAQESLVAMRLLLHRPLHYQGSGPKELNKGPFDGHELLRTAVSVLERSQSKRSWAQFAQWAWFKWVKWYALAVVLVELCHSDPAHYAWPIAERSLDDYASIVADSDSGLLWLPIKRLMHKACTNRTRLSTAQHDANVSLYETNDYQYHRSEGWSLGFTDASSSSEPRLENHSSLEAEDTLSGAITNDYGADSDLGWCDWASLMHDIEHNGVDF